MFFRTPAFDDYTDALHVRLPGSGEHSVAEPAGASGTSIAVSCSLPVLVGNCGCESSSNCCAVPRFRTQIEDKFAKENKHLERVACRLLALF